VRLDVLETESLSTLWKINVSKVDYEQAKAVLTFESSEIVQLLHDNSTKVAYHAWDLGPR